MTCVFVTRQCACVRACARVRACVRACMCVCKTALLWTRPARLWVKLSVYLFTFYFFFIYSFLFSSCQRQRTEFPSRINAVWLYSIPVYCCTMFVLTRQVLSFTHPRNICSLNSHTAALCSLWFFRQCVICTYRDRINQCVLYYCLLTTFFTAETPAEGFLEHQSKEWSLFIVSKCPNLSIHTLLARKMKL